MDHLDLIPKLSFLFSVVLIPKAVRKDLFRRRNTKDRVRSFFQNYDFFRPCNDYDQASVDLLLMDRRRTGTRDRGEAEAVAQAAQFGAAVIVDDRWGRDLAARFSLEYHGTLWVLQRFHELGLLTSAEVRECFVSLQRRGLRLPADTVDKFLRNVGEEPVFSRLI